GRPAVGGAVALVGPLRAAVRLAGRRLLRRVVVMGVAGVVARLVGVVLAVVGVVAAVVGAVGVPGVAAGVAVRVTGGAAVRVAGVLRDVPAVGVGCLAVLGRLTVLLAALGLLAALPGLSLLGVLPRPAATAAVGLAAAA